MSHKSTSPEIYRQLMEQEKLKNKNTMSNEEPNYTEQLYKLMQPIEEYRGIKISFSKGKYWVLHKEFNTIEDARKHVERGYESLEQSIHNFNEKI